MSLTSGHQNLEYLALSQYAETLRTPEGFRIELNSKKFKAGNASQVDAIGNVLARYPHDQVSVQVYSGAEPIKDAEAIRDQLIESGVSPRQIILNGLSQDQPTTMWLEIAPKG